MPTQPAFPTSQLRIEAWDDPIVDRLGHDPRSTYVETYWLGILGPSACWLLRRMADGLDADPDGFDMDLSDTAAAIGLRLNGGRHAPFLRTLGRLCQFRMARQCGPDVLEVRRRLPPLTLAQVDRLPVELRDRHRARVAEQGQRTITTDDPARRIRRLALTLVQLGEDRDATARQLREWRFDTGLCDTAAGWAWNIRHRLAAPPPGTSRPPGTSGPPANRSPEERPALDGAA